MNKIRQCREEESRNPNFRKSFSDLDYAMLGYDIIKGYPDFNGHDPGFTYPIFSSDYSAYRQTSDCRYSVPNGFVVIPDVSCVTSFSSTIIRNSFELQKSLSGSVQASGGFGGFSFSASSSYKKASSEVSTGEKVYVKSWAKCTYYFSKVDQTRPPVFHPGFYRWVKALERNNSEANLLAFVKYYGTHFATSVVFGARFIKQHSMTSESYKRVSSNKFSVAAQASYSGLVSVSGGFTLDKSQREAASQFSQAVETTTITVGAAPPSNGDAIFWASSVKENPVPTSYKLEPIANLFTEVFMKGTGINYQLIRKKLVGIEKRYCQQLKVDGTVNTCDDSVTVGIVVPKHYLEEAKHPHKIKCTESSCIFRCFEDRYCLSVSYLPDSSTCYFHDGKSYLIKAKQKKKNSPKIIIFPTRINDLKANFTINNLRITTSARYTSKQAVDLSACKKHCLKDPFCDVFSFCHKDNCDRQEINCKLYSYDMLTSFERDEKTVTYFINRGGKNDTESN